MTRTTTEVLQDHLNKRLQGAVDEDIRKNFAPNVILLSTFGTFRGHAGIKKSSEKLAADLEESKYEYNHLQIEESFAFLEWSAVSEKGKVCDGADSFMVEDGKIILQTVHYSPPKDAGQPAKK